MTRSTRGAARISIVWMITVLVLFFVSLGFAFIATTDLTRAEGNESKAKVEAADAVARFDTEANVRREQTVRVGYFDESAADPSINLEAMKIGLNTFKDEFGITDASPETFEDHLAPAVKEYKRVKAELEVKRNRITTLEGELNQARRTTSDITAAKDTELASLRQQLSDDANKFQNNQADNAKRLANAQQEAVDANTKLIEAGVKSEEALAESAKALDVALARQAALARTLALPKEPDTPDGEVLSVSSKLPVGWINIGANDRLARGTVFDVYAGGTGEKRMKARCRVTSLKPTMAEVSFFDVANGFDPIVSGDIIENSVFVPGGQRNAVLAGRFSSPSEAELIAMLDRIGITVQSGLQLDTHYLIVGSAMFEDEDGEPLDEPRQPYELDIYREAEAKNVSIIPMSDLRGYFVF